MFAYAGQEPKGKVGARVCKSMTTGRGYYKTLTPVRTACPILRELFRIVDEEKEFSQIQIGKGLGVTNWTINAWRGGRTQPDMFTYLEFAKLLGVNIGVIKEK